MKSALIQSIDKVARTKFTYKADPPTWDTWRSHAEDVFAKRNWTGDCDDLASTVLDLLGQAGMPLTSRYRCMVDSQGGHKIDHMIAVVLDDQNHFWFVGDTNGEATREVPSSYTFIEYARLDQINQRRKGAPFHV